MKCVCPMGGDRVCPDDCPLAVWAGLSTKDRKAQRKPIAEKLYKQHFTMDQIATQLGVSKATIGRDLELSHDETIKSTKTVSNPKGAGRPKGSKQTKPKTDIPLKPHYSEAQVIALADKGLSDKEIATETSIGARQIRHIIDGERKAREGAARAIDRSELSMTAQEKLDAVIKQYQRELNQKFETRVRDDCKRWLDEISLPHYLKQLEQLERRISNRQGIMNKVTFDAVRRCLHPDSRATVSEERLAEAFRLFNSLEKLVLNEKESPTDFRRDIPRTYEELMAARARRKAERRAARKGGIAHR
jgi:predicted ArsR family transcriptional regulator